MPAGRPIAVRDGMKEEYVRFLAEFSKHGQITTACRESGVATTTAYWLLKQPSFQAALTVEIRRRLQQAVPMALSTLVELAERATSERVRVDASKAIIDRAGFVAPKAAARDEGAELTLTEMTIDQLKDLAGKLEDEISGRAKSINMPPPKDNAPPNAGSPIQPVDLLG